MELNHRLLNRTRLKVNLLESRVQPGSLFTTGLAETGALAHAGAQPDRVSHNVLVPHTESIRIIPAAVQRTRVESTPDTVAPPDQRFDHALLRTASLADAPLADPLALGTTPRLRIVRQRAESGAMVRQGGIADVAVSSAGVSTPSRAIPRAVAAQSAGDAAARAVPLGFRADSGTNSRDTISAAQKQTIAENYGRLPLSFEQNVGQFDDRVDFVTRTGGMTTFLTPTAAVFSIQNSESRIQNSESGSEPRPLGSGLRGEPLAKARSSETNTSSGVALYMEIVGGNPEAPAVGGDQLPGIVNYFIGNDPSQWHANIGTFGRVAYQDVYPGVDLVYYGNDGALEYDFIVSPGADPNQIALTFAGADGIEINRQGDLIVHTVAGDLIQRKPYLYQEVSGARQQVAGEFQIQNPVCSRSTDYCPLTTAYFEVGSYDPTQPLVIDPLVLGYSTYLGAGGFSDDIGYAIAVDAAGNAYVTGWTFSYFTKFPTTAGAFDTSYNGYTDAFVAKLRADGAGLVYSTYYGGSSYDYGHGVALDTSGNAYVGGVTSSTDLPTTPGAYDTGVNGDWDAFVAKLSADGSSLSYGTYLGGSSLDRPTGFTVDAVGNAFVTGYTNSTNFPTTSGAFDTSYNSNADAFVAKLNADGASLGYGTYLGGSGNDVGAGIALDAGGNASISGHTRSANFPTTPGAFDTSYNSSDNDDGFVVKLRADGAGLLYGTYLGGFLTDHASGIAVDAAGNAFVTGYTYSTDFPTTPGAFDTSLSLSGYQDAFVVKLSAGGASVDYGTYLGGSHVDDGWAIAVDAAGNAYVTGDTVSTNFPTTPGAFDTGFNGAVDTIVTKLSADGKSLVYGTYLGGSNVDAGYTIAVDGGGTAYVMGQTVSTDFPTTPGALKRRNRGANDAFVTKFAEV